MLQKEEEGGRKGTVWCRDFLKGILSPSRHLRLKGGPCECVGVTT